MNEELSGKIFTKKYFVFYKRMYKEDTWTCYLRFVLIRLGFIKKEASIDLKSFGVFSNQITELRNFN